MTFQFHMLIFRGDLLRKIFDDVLATNMSSSPVVRRSACANSIKPSTQTLCDVEVRESSMNDEKHFLADIVGVGFRNSKAAKRAPDECPVLVEESGKVIHKSVRAQRKRIGGRGYTLHTMDWKEVAIFLIIR